MRSMEHLNWHTTEEDPVQGSFYEEDWSNLNHSQVNTSRSYAPLLGQSYVIPDPLPNMEYQGDTNSRTYPNYRSDYGNAEPSSQNRPAESPSEGHYGMVYQGNNAAEDIPASTPLTREPARLSNQVPIQSNPNPLPNSLQYRPGVAQYLTNELDPWTVYSAGYTPTHHPHPGPSQWPAMYSQENQAMHISIASIPRSPPENQAVSNVVFEGQQMDPISYTDVSGNIGWINSPHPRSPEVLAEAPPYIDVSEMHHVAANFDDFVQPGISTRYGTAPAETHFLVGNSHEYRPSLGNFDQLTGYVDLRPGDMQITDNEHMVESHGQANTQFSSPNGHVGQPPISPNEISPGKKKVKRRRSNARAQHPIRPRDNTPSEDTSSIASGFQILDPNMNPTSSRRKRKLSDEGRRHAKEMRRYGSCAKCRRKKCKVFYRSCSRDLC